MKKLTTTEGVLEWVTGSVDRCGAYRGSQDTAAYLARAVRIAEAYDAAMGMEQGRLIASKFLLGHLQAAAEGGSDECFLDGYLKKRGIR